MNQTVNRGALTAGVFFIVVGIAFLLDELDVWELTPSIIWPSLLVVLGAAVLLGGIFRKQA